MRRVVIPMVGDKLCVVGRGEVPHFGIVVEAGPVGLRIVHNDKDAGYVRETANGAFSGGATVYLVSRSAKDGWDRSTVARRARSLIGTEYDLVNFNCEHVANYAETGKAFSQSVNTAGALALFGLFVLWNRK